MSASSFNADLKPHLRRNLQAKQQSSVLSDVPSATSTLVTRSISVSTGVSYTSDYRWPHKYKSITVKSGNLGGHATVTLRPIHMFPNVSLRNWRASLVLWAGAPSCWNHMHRVHINANLPAVKAIYLEKTWHTVVQLERMASNMVQRESHEQCRLTHW